MRGRVHIKLLLARKGLRGVWQSRPRKVRRSTYRAGRMSRALGFFPGT